MPEQAAQNQAEAVEQIGGLLSGSSDDSPDGLAAVPNAPEGAEPQADAGEDAGASELTPTSLAESLGIKPAELFKQLRIPVEGGDPLTLEEFKDSGKELRGLTAARNELAEQRVQFENQAMLQRQQLQAAVAKIPANLLTPEVIGEVQAEHVAHVETERQALHTVRPDLRDPAKWNATRDLLVEHLTPYGFHAIEVDSIIDHRLAKYVIDNAERAKRIQVLEAESKEKPKKPLQRPAGSRAPVSKRAQGNNATQRGRAAVNNQDKAAEVAKLLGANL